MYFIYFVFLGWYWPVSVLPTVVVKIEFDKYYHMLVMAGRVVWFFNYLKL